MDWYDVWYIDSTAPNGADLMDKPATDDGWKLFACLTGYTNAASVVQRLRSEFGLYAWAMRS